MPGSGVARLRIGIDRSEGHLVIDGMVPGPDASPPVRVPFGRYPLSEVGVPTRLDGSRGLDASRPPRLPGDFWRGVAGLCDRAAPLWLEFPDVGSYAMLLPWERALAKVRHGPVYRVPLGGIDRRPLRPDAVVVVVASSPETKEWISVDGFAHPMARAISHVLPQGNVHWFVDRGQKREVARELPNVHVHESEPGVGWQDWIRSRVERADMLHFVGHGVVNGDCGAIALAWTPDENRHDRARFLDAAPVARLADQLGARVIGLGAPQPNYATVGLRLLAADLSVGGTRTVLLHEFNDGENQAQLVQALRVIAGEPVSAPIPDVTLYRTPPDDALAPEAWFDASAFVQDALPELHAGSDLAEPIEVEPVSLEPILQRARTVAPQRANPEMYLVQADIRATAPRSQRSATRREVTQELLGMEDPSEEDVRALVDRLIQSEEE
jgi:hypothetical protein